MRLCKSLWAREIWGVDESKIKEREKEGGKRKTKRVKDQNPQREG